MRLFRQTKLGNWPGVFREIETVLRQQLGLPVETKAHSFTFSVLVGCVEQKWCVARTGLP